VVLAVAVIPELLSGPKPAAPAAELPRLPVGAPDPVRNVTVDLTTSKPALAAAATSAPIPAQAPAAMPVPTPAPEAASPGGPAPSAPASAAAPSLETAAPPPRSGREWAVQLGIFANRSNADKLVHQLKAQGFSIYVAAEGTGGAARYRVRSGPLADRDSAERTVAKLKAQGIAATIVAAR
jgi:DedD protein